MEMSAVKSERKLDTLYPYLCDVEHSEHRTMKEMRTEPSVQFRSENLTIQNRNFNNPSIASLLSCAIWLARWSVMDRLRGIRS